LNKSNSIENPWNCNGELGNWEMTTYKRRISIRACVVWIPYEIAS
jgi:hypothetical protein